MIIMKIAIIFIVNYLVLAATYPSLVKDADSQWPCRFDFSCGDPSYAMQDMKLSLSPNPPLPGKNLTITASGSLKKQISGGKITLLTKYNSIRVFDEVYDACYLFKQLGRQCPIPAGTFGGTDIFKVPSFFISGKYYSRFDATDQDGGRLACGQITCQI